MVKEVHLFKIGEIIGIWFVVIWEFWQIVILERIAELDELLVISFEFSTISENPEIDGCALKDASIDFFIANDLEWCDSAQLTSWAGEDLKVIGLLCLE